jgi:predicted cupin superfamily sugar epimerase
MTSPTLIRLSLTKPVSSCPILWTYDSVDPPSRSLFHRLAYDEIWHFYAGDPLRLVLLHPDGSDEEVVLGDAVEGHAVQHVIPAGTWQAGETVPGGA